MTRVVFGKGEGDMSPSMQPLLPLTMHPNTPIQDSRVKFLLVAKSSPSLVSTTNIITLALAMTFKKNTKMLALPDTKNYWQCVYSWSKQYTLLPTIVRRSGQSVCLFVCFFVCLFVRRIIQKRKTPKCSNLVQKMILGYPRSDTVLGLKGRRSRLELGLTAIRRHGFELCQCLLVFFTFLSIESTECFT